MKNIISIIFFLTCTLVTAQNCKHLLKGVIMDFHNTTPIENATIKVLNSNVYAISNKKGAFVLKDICNDIIEIEIAHIGCTSKIVTIEFKKEQFKTIFLEHHLEELEEVSLNTKQKKSVQENIIKEAVLNKYSGQSLGDALKEVAGVSSINTGNTIVKPIINGLHSSRILIMNNNVRLQDQEWGIEHAPNIDINSVGQISIIKGSNALAYGGDAIGGVVVLKPRKVILKDTLYGKTIIGGQTNGQGYNLSTTFNKNYSTGWFAQIQGSYTKNGDFKAPDYNLTNSGLDSKGLSARFGKKKFESGFEVYYSYLNNEIGILRSAHIGNIKNLATAINAEKPFFIEDFSYDINEPKQEVIHHLFKTSYYKRFKNFGKIDIQYDYQNNERFEFDIRLGGRSVIPAIDLRLQTHSILANVKIDNNLERKYNFGILTRYQDHFANPDTGVRRLIPDYEKYDFGLYTTTEWRINENLIADAGIRYDFSRIDALKFYRVSHWENQGYNDDFRDIIIGSVIGQNIDFDIINPNASKYLTNPSLDFHNISGATGIKYRFNKNHQVSLNYSLASRAPNASELFSDGLHHSAARIEIGDLRIDSEHSNRISATYGYTGPKVNFVVEPYYNKINNFIYLIPGPDGIIPLIRGPFPVWEYIQTDAAIFGIDINAKYQITPHWNTNNKIAFIKGYDILADLPLLDIPPFMTSNGITYTKSNWNNFNASLQSEWVFEQNEFPNEFNYTVPIANEEDIFVNLSPPSAYHLMHFQSEITLPIFKHSSLNIRFSINNIFNTDYRNYLNRLRFFADDLGRNFKLQILLKY